MQQLSHDKFEMVFKEYYPSLCNIAFSIVKDRYAAEDIVQELFASLWKNRENLNIREDIKYYLFRAARNRTLNYIRDRKSFEDIEAPGVDARVQDNNPQGQLEQLELMASIQKAVDALPEKCREVFKLSRFEKKSYKEIATVLNISEKTVENQISKALKIMREKLKLYVGEKAALVLFLLMNLFYFCIGACMFFSVVP